MKRFFLMLMCLAAAMVLSSCMAQVSSLESYKGVWKNPTDKCLVVRTSLDSKFEKWITKYDEYMLGDSHAATTGTYEDVEAAYDCMSVGAKSVVVLDRGVVGSSTTYIPGSTVYNYNPSTNSVGSFSTPGFFVNESTSGFVVAFFSIELPYEGREYTMEMYKTWKQSNAIVTCQGC